MKDIWLEIFTLLICASEVAASIYLVKNGTWGGVIYFAFFAVLHFGSYMSMIVGNNDKRRKT